VERAPEWLRPARRAALARFAELGVPGPRDEEWRSTNLRPLRDLAFRLAEGGPAPDSAALAALWFAGPGGGLSGPRLVFVNGRYCEELSRTWPLPEGVTVTRLASGLSTHRGLVEAHLGRLATIEPDAFTSLNLALFDDGVLMHVPSGVKVEDPVHVLSLTTSADAALLSSPRNLVVAGEGAQATFVEDYASLADGPHLTNAVTEIAVGPGADVRHYLIERENDDAFNVSTLKVRQQRDSRFASHSVLLGGRLVRNNVNPVLAGEGCYSLLNGLFVGNGVQHLDNHMRVEHAMPNCQSRQYYRGILADRAHGVFSGRIVVVQDAQKTDAIQSNDNLLLSDSAQVNTKPQLEIYADDVRCTHGATVGQLDEKAIFYLRSRGLPETAARAALVYAFARESLERMQLEPIRAWLSRALLDRLPMSTALHRVFD
jgi:Fe-S cluster assembly protein SufD